jgi:hypothetical protein
MSLKVPTSPLLVAALAFVSGVGLLLLPACGKKAPGGPCLPCDQVGVQRCAGGLTQTCAEEDGCKGWQLVETCASGQCNSAGTSCHSGSSTCEAGGECGCGCSCLTTTNECVCSSSVPVECSEDAECGLSCLGLVCKDKKCVTQS